MNFLKTSKHIQSQVYHRLQELSSIAEKGNFKSQRGGSETLFVAKQVPWPQNKVLEGSSKNRVSYDNLSIYQWISGFSTIAREEGNFEVKNQMLDYLSDIMDDILSHGRKQSELAAN